MKKNKSTARMQTALLVAHCDCDRSRYGTELDLLSIIGDEMERLVKEESSLILSAIIDSNKVCRRP